MVEAGWQRLGGGRWMKKAECWRVDAKCLRVDCGRWMMEAGRKRLNDGGLPKGWSALSRTIFNAYFPSHSKLVFEPTASADRLGFNHIALHLKVPFFSTSIQSHVVLQGAISGGHQAGVCWDQTGVGSVWDRLPNPRSPEEGWHVHISTRVSRLWIVYPPENLPPPHMHTHLEDRYSSWQDLSISIHSLDFKEFLLWRE